MAGPCNTVPVNARLFASRERVYLDGMDDTRQPPKDWSDALDRAKADVAAGRVVDGAELHRKLEASIGRMTRSTSPAPERIVLEHPCSL